MYRVDVLKHQAACNDFWKNNRMVVQVNAFL